MTLNPEKRRPGLVGLRSTGDKLSLSNRSNHSGKQLTRKNATHRRTKT